MSGRKLSIVQRNVAVQNDYVRTRKLAKAIILDPDPCRGSVRAGALFLTWTEFIWAKP